MTPAVTPRERALTVLRLLIAVVALGAAAVGLFAAGGPGPHPVDTIRGGTADLYGKGLYASDTWLIGSANRGTDAAVLLFEVPVLLVALVWCRRDSLRGRLLLTGVTYAIDLGLIVPVVLLAGVLLHRRRPLGHLLAVFTILLNLTLGVALIGQGAAQIIEDVPLKPGEKVGFIGSFAVLTMVSIALSIALFRSIADGDPADR